MEFLKSAEMDLIFASANKHKLRELNGLGLEVVLRSYGEIFTHLVLAEDELTFEGNAVSKASQIFKLTGQLTLAEDSGLEVEALNGAPGVYSARFAGPKATDKENCDNLLKLLHGVKNRRAKFTAVLAYIDCDGKVSTYRGECHGKIAESHALGHGFGYDPIFIPEGESLPFSLLPKEFKLKVSHRTAAFKAFCSAQGLR